MKFLNRIGLRARILLNIGLLALITVGGGLVMVWYTYRMESLFTDIVRTNVASLEAARELETALLNQRGFVSYYFLDKDPVWLKELGKYRQIFEERLKNARQAEQSAEAGSVLDTLEREYKEYIEAKDRVIEFYKSGNYEAGARLHREVRDKLFDIIVLCEEYRKVHGRGLESAWAVSQAQARGLRLIAGSAMTVAVLLAALLSFLLVTQILEPIRRLAMETGWRGKPVGPPNDVTALKAGVRGLIADFDQTHLELEKSRERLLQSEKMATVGKLAAEVAHSIRNPMTSIKMRLFSLERALELSPTQREDFEVISEEMRHLDNIVRNFLEFSRPPKLKIQKMDISEVVDNALQLLGKRIERHGIRLERKRNASLPAIEGDPELLKEVLVNLIVNACDVMQDGGFLVISEEEAVAEHMGRAILVKLRDTGSGIPESIRDRVLEPFFTTKEEGTGLGLSIAVRTLEEHGGRLDFRTDEGKGTTFTITLPVREEET